MSLTATGLDVNTRGGSLGGLTRSLTFRNSERYHGSSTASTNRRDRWSSAVLGCKSWGFDRSAIFYLPALAVGEPLSSIRRTVPAITALQVLENPHPETSPDRKSVV